jgi:hypothetical protein
MKKPRLAPGPRKVVPKKRQRQGKPKCASAATAKRKTPRPKVPSPFSYLDPPLPADWPPRHLWPKVYPYAERVKAAILADELDELRRAAQFGTDLAKLENAIASYRTEPDAEEHQGNGAPRSKRGRPRMDKERELVRKAKASGKTWKEIAQEVNAETGQNKTHEAYRGLLKTTITATRTSGRK